MNDVLTAVGGWGISGRTNKLVTLRQSQWVKEYPPMNTARSSPAVVCTSNGMNAFVIGGYGDSGEIDAAELYNTESGSWSCLTSLPQPLTLPSAVICYNQLHVIDGDGLPSAVICYNQLHVIGGDGDGYSCSLQAFLSSNQQIRSQSISRTLTWTALPRLPVQHSTAATLRGQLLIIGGMKGCSSVDSILQLVGEQWVQIGPMPAYMNSGRKLCLVASPSPDQIVVVGGRGTRRTDVDSVNVYVAR